MEDILGIALNIDPLTNSSANVPATATVQSNTVPVAPPANTTPLIVDQDDYEFARENIRTLVKAGFVSLTELQQIALQGSSAYGYEVVSSLIKTLSETNKDLLELALKKKKILEVSLGQLESPSQTNINNAAIFVGSTNELQKALKKEGVLDITQAVFEDEYIQVDDKSEK